MTSPPYYFLRDYQCAGQIGLEPSLGEYLRRLAAAFDEVRRVLKPGGVCWVNVGDSRCSRRAVRPAGLRTVAKGGRTPTWAESAALGLTMHPSRYRAEGIGEGDWLLVPERLVAVLLARGWHVVREHAWHNPAKPLGRTRRPEHVIALSPSARAVLNKDVPPSWAEPVWRINGSQHRAAHCAMMPLELARRCVLLATRPGDRVIDPFAGTGTTAVVANGHGRHAVLVELNPDYAAHARERMRWDSGARANGSADTLSRRVVGDPHS